MRLVVGLTVFLAVLVVLVLVPVSSAEETYFKYGMQAPGSPRSSKVFGLSYQDDLDWGLIYSAEADILSIPSNPNPASFVISPGLGLKVNGGSCFATAVWGPAYLSQPDQELGGSFQFMQDLNFGIQDKYNLIGFGYKHISSAGIEKPNRGKDYLYIRIGVKLQ